MSDALTKHTKLSAVIRTVRGRLGLTQDQFGKLISVGQTSVSRWELGVCPDVGRLVQLLDLAQGEDEIAVIMAALVSLGFPVSNLASATHSTDRTSAVAC